MIIIPGGQKMGTREESAVGAPKLVARRVKRVPPTKLSFDVLVALFII